MLTDTQNIFAGIVAHAVEGVMIHRQFKQIFEFMGFKGFAKIHENQYFDELRKIECIDEYCLNHKCQLIPDKKIETPSFIPDKWFDVKKTDVDSGTRRAYTKILFDRWREWETETKSTLSNARKEFESMGDHATAMFIDDLIKDVDIERVRAEFWCIEFDAIDYNVIELFNRQDRILNMYK